MHLGKSDFACRVTMLISHELPPTRSYWPVLGTSQG